MNDAAELIVAPARPGWNWFPSCCLICILGVIGMIPLRAHMDGLTDPDDLDEPIVVVCALLFLSLPLTAVAFWAGPPELSRAARGWLKQALLLQAVGLLWAVLVFLGGQLSKSIAFDRTVQNAHRVAAAVEEFRLWRGRYPQSLAEVERDTGRGLPRPV